MDGTEKIAIAERLPDWAGYASRGVAEDNRWSLTSQAYAQLRSDIIAGILAPGEKLKIHALRERYGMGTTPLREALSQLTSKSLVERIDQRGFRVKTIDKDEFEELLKARCWLEEIALRQSIRNGDAGWEEQLVVAAWRLSRVHRSNNLDENQEWEWLHKVFHMTLIGACGSSFLLETCSDLYDLNIRYRQVSRLSDFGLRDVEGEHDEIFNAAARRDEDQAVALLIQHYHRTGELLRQWLEQ